MHMWIVSRVVLLLVVCQYLFIHSSNALSVCRSTDILCFIDATTITQRSDDIRNFVNQLVLKGTSERSSLAVVLYGDLPAQTYKKDENIILIHSYDTLNFKKGRKYKQKMVDKKLDFSSFFDAKGKDKGTRSVSLMDAFRIVTEHNPNDLPQQIMVFESDDSSVSDTEACDALRQHTNDIHFITDYRKPSFDNCGQQTHRNVSYTFDQILNKMEIVYDFSCPTDMDVADEDGAPIGRISLQKHTNYISTAAMVSCDLSYNDEGQLSTSSTVRVIDDLEDDMTFEVDEYLIIKKDDFLSGSLPPECKYPIYKITGIEKEAQSTQNILILSVSTPATFEYITDMNINVTQSKGYRMKGRYKEKGKPVNPKSPPGQEKKESDSPVVPSRRRMLAYSEIYGPSGLSWGSWDSSFDPANPICAGTPAYCFNLKVDPSGSGANAIRFLCANGMIDKRANDGPHGAWMTNTLCCPQTEAQKAEGVIGNFIVGACQRVEPSQGWFYDDSAVNDVVLKCADGTDLWSTNGAKEGVWKNWVTCPTGYAVGAYNQRVEPNQGIGDDTGLNDMKFYCYPVDATKKYYGSADVNAGMSDPEGSFKLIDIDTGLKKISYSITATSVPTSEGSSFKFKGTVSISVGFQLQFALSVAIVFDWSFSIWDGFTVNKLSCIFGIDAMFYASLDVVIDAWLTFTIPKILSFERDYIVWVGYIPVLVTPYFQTDLILNSPKIGLEINTYYRYRAVGMKFGVEYTSAGGWKTINEAGTKTEESDFKIALRSGWDSETCTFTLKLSGTLRTYVGAKFYKILAAFVYADVVSSNELILPTTCEGATQTDKCQNTYMHAVLRNRQALSVGVGIGLAINSDMFKSISQYLSDLKLMVGIPGLQDIELFKKEFCIELSGILSPINTLFKGLCCSSSARIMGVGQPLRQIGYDGDRDIYGNEGDHYNDHDFNPYEFEHVREYNYKEFGFGEINVNRMVGTLTVIAVLTCVYIAVLSIKMWREKEVFLPEKSTAIFP